MEIVILKLRTEVNRMELLENWNRAISYMEEHLSDDVDLEKAAGLACCSIYHFQRMFSYMTDISVSEYIRRRKMSLAAAELQRGQVKILDLALKYGYESPTAFNRAFKSIHGVAPSQARREGVVLKTYPPISFKITIKGEYEMNYKIVTKEAFRVVGKKAHFTGGIEESFQRIPRLWAEANRNQLISELCRIMDPEIPGIMGICTSAQDREFDYYIGAVSQEPAPPGMEELQIDAGTWAVFECIGAMPDSIQSLQKRIITEWLPGAGYEYSNAPDIEVYFEGDQSSADYRCQVWMPVIKK